MISNHPKFNLGQLNAYKLMFAIIKLSMEKRISNFLAAWFSDLPVINATVFSINFATFVFLSFAEDSSS